MNWLKNLINRILGRKVVATIDVQVPMYPGMTQEDAITMSGTAIRAGLKHLGGDISHGNVQHHMHDYPDGMSVHHAVWVHDARAAELEAERVE